MVSVQREVAVSAGVHMQQDRIFAALVHGETVIALPELSSNDIGAATRALVAATPTGCRIDSVTVDLSEFLLAAVAAGSSELDRVAVIRIVPRQTQDPLLGRSPSDTVEGLIRARFHVGGGHDLLGNELCALDSVTLAQVCSELDRQELRRIAIVAAGSQSQPQHERAVADAIEAAIPNAHISAASDFGGQGLVGREATVVLDSGLGALIDAVIDRWEKAVAAHIGSAQLRVARGDGGYSTPAWMRALPSVALGATPALELAGAAHLAGLQDCRVLLPRADGRVAGDVRHGLPVVRAVEIAALGVELVVPTAALASTPNASAANAASSGADIPVCAADRPTAELACIGAAVSCPTAWLDEVAYIESAQALERVRRDAASRARAIVMANGAEPGTTRVTELTTVAVPYSPSGTVRIRVQVAGRTHPAQESTLTSDIPS